MPATVQEIYIQVTRSLSPAERLRLATLILNDLVKQDDYSDMWTAEDELDIAAFSFNYDDLEYSEDPSVSS